MGDNAAVEDYEGLVEVADQGPEGLYEYFSERGWGDGLPLVAPTHERVEESLSHADGDPDEPVAILSPRAGVAPEGRWPSTPCWPVADPSTCRWC